MSNEELVASLSKANTKWNAEHASAIERGDVLERDMPSEAFIRKASGIGHRYVMDKDGILDPERLRPRLPLRSEDELSIQAEICLDAAKEALAQAGREGSDVDAVIVGCSNLQRGLSRGRDRSAGRARRLGFRLRRERRLLVRDLCDPERRGRAAGGECEMRVGAEPPEITSGHNNFELREFHFIFGDACTAVLLETEDHAGAGERWEESSERDSRRSSRTRSATMPAI